MDRREFIKIIGISSSAVAVTSIFGLPAQAARTSKFDPDEYANRILKGDRTTLAEAPGIPPRAMNQVGELLFLKITTGVPCTDAGKSTFQDFISLRCVPWHMCDSVTRRISKSRKGELQGWLLGHMKLRARILAAMDDERETNHHIRPHGNMYRWPNRMPKRTVPFNEPAYWNDEK